MRSTYLNETAINGVSEKYAIVCTKPIVDKLTESLSDWTMTSYREANVRLAEKVGKQKHQITFRRNTPIDGELAPVIHVLNSYDRTQALTISVGLFRFWCSNGLVIGDDWGSFKIKHLVGAVARQDVQGFMDTLPSVIDQSVKRVELLKSATLTEDQVMNVVNIATKAMKMTRPQMTEDDLDNASKFWIRPRRQQDKDNNLWNVYNRVQESVVRGGYGLRAINRLDTSHRVNKYLWNQFTDLAMQ